MPALLELRENIINLYRRGENIIRPVYRFLAALLAMADINGRIGYEENLTGFVPVLLVALLSSLLPGGAIVAILAVVILVHLYALSLEAALVGLILLVLLLLLYFRFSPKDSMLLVFSPAAYMFGIPYALPVAGGLLYNPGSAVTVAVAAVIHSYLTFISENEAAILSAASDEDMISRFRFLIDGLVQNKAMFVMAAAAAAATVVVYIVRRLSVPYSWYIAVGTGSLVQLIVLLVGDMVYTTNVSILGMFLGVIVSIAIGVLMTFFLFHLDYTRIENVQFEDEEYYYYVRAIPKITYRESNRTVKTISTSRHVRGKRGSAAGAGASDASSYGRPDAAGYASYGGDEDGVEEGSLDNYSADDYGADNYGYEDYEGGDEY